MFRSHRSASAAVVAGAMLVLLAGTAPASAIVGGREDTTNIFDNVGGLEYRYGTDWRTECTGTLIRSDVVLTAGHCVFGVETADLRVNFNPVRAAPWADPDDPLAYAAARIVIHPDFAWGGNGVNGITALASPFEDIALIWLEKDVTGITPATVASLGYLDDLDLSAQTFTVVGYGWDDVTSGSFMSGASHTYPSYRSYREVTILGDGPYPDRFILHSEATCMGDSGGPLLVGDTVVGVATWGLSLRCSGPSLHYRVDSSIAQEFLAENL